MTNELDWTHNVTEVTTGGLRRERDATGAERDAMARTLGLLAVHKLAAQYRIQAIAGDGHRLTGKVSADVDQACVVTLEPLKAHVEDTFDVEFWPHVEAGDTAEELSILDGPDVERIEDGIIPVGRIVFETFSAALDPFPRRDDAAFTWQDPHAADLEKASPFAALSKLKDKG